MLYHHKGGTLASFGIGAKLRQERIGRGLTIEDVARETRIAPRFLQAIEVDDFDSLPGLIFTRNFVRQYALSLKLDPDPLVAELPNQDESTVRLPDPPARARSSYQTDRRMNSMVWLVLASGAAMLAWFHFNHSGEMQAASRESAPVQKTSLVPAAPAPTAPPSAAAIPVQEKAPQAPVQVVITAHRPVWVKVSADGKTIFTGTLHPDETREINAVEQVNILAGNAGGLTISLNGKMLEPLGPSGQIRAVRLTAEGPEFLARDPQPAFDLLDPL